MNLLGFGFLISSMHLLFSEAKGVREREVGRGGPAL